MWWHRAAEDTAEASEVVSFRRVGAIRPVGPDGTIRAYTSRDLRTHLSALSVHLSQARKMAAMLPLVVALAAWFVVPSYAAAPRPAHGVHAAAPVAAPPAQGPISSGPISVVPIGGTPVTGAGDGIMRTSIVGMALLLAGLVVLTAPRRNPHAEAVWREARTGGPDTYA